MVPDEDIRAAGVEPMDLAGILARDVISIHTPLTEGTLEVSRVALMRSDLHPSGARYSELDSVPAVIRRNRASTVEALQQSGVDKYDIPAFLRKQAD